MMRIPVGSCEGCNKNAELTLSGGHPLGDGKWIRCKFVDAELNDINPPVELVSVHIDRNKAVRAAKRANGALLWIGQAPYHIWLVVRDVK